MPIFTVDLTNVILSSGNVWGNSVCPCPSRLLFIHFEAIWMGIQLLACWVKHIHTWKSCIQMQGKNKHLSENHMSTAHIRITDLLWKLLENVHNKHRRIRIKKYAQYISRKISRQDLAMAGRIILKWLLEKYAKLWTWNKYSIIESNNRILWKLL